MRCAVCSRQAKGLGYFNPRLRRSDPRRYSDRWVFCSMPCQNAFSRLMERLTQFQEDAVIDPSDMELAAMRSALAPLGEYVASIGMDRPLADYGKDEVLRLVEVVVDAYQAHMLAEHERMATNVADVYAGSYDYPLTFLKKTDKTLWACGAGAYWGNANGSNSGNFVQVPVGNTVVKAVHGGTGSYNYGAALLENGTVCAWGYNGNGALGLGDATNRSSVELVRIAQRRVVDISSYGSSSEQGLVFLLDDGQVLASGYAGEAQLPEDDSETSYVPYPVIL